MSPVQHPIIRHLLSSDGRTNCGRPTEGKHITTTLDLTTCSVCRYVHKSLESLEVEKSPAQKTYHGMAPDGRTLCGRSANPGVGITYTPEYITCANCRAVRNDPRPLIDSRKSIVEESPEVEMSQPSSANHFTHRQVAEVFATQVRQISSSAANEVNEYLRAADDDSHQYLYTLRQLAIQLHTLVVTIRSVGDLIDNVDAKEQFLAKSRYWLLRALRNSVDYTIAEIEADINV